jgi:hypothetical protein
MAINTPVHAIDDDWRQQKVFILNSLETLGTKVDVLSDSVNDGFAELRTDVALLKQAQSAHLSQDELEAIITGAMAKKKDSQTLTRDDIRRIAEESVKAKNGVNGKVKPNGVEAWAPWRYVVLGAILLGGNRLIELVLPI